MLNKKLVFAFLSVCFIAALFSFSYLKELSYEENASEVNRDDPLLVHTSLPITLHYAKKGGVQRFGVYSASDYHRSPLVSEYRDLDVPREYILYNVSSNLFTTYDELIERIENEPSGMNYGTYYSPYWVYTGYYYNQAFGYGPTLYLNYPDFSPLSHHKYSSPIDVPEVSNTNILVVKINLDYLTGYCPSDLSFLPQSPSKGLNKHDYEIKNNYGGVTAGTIYRLVLDDNVQMLMCCRNSVCSYGFRSVDEFFIFDIEFHESLAPEIEKIKIGFVKLFNSFKVKTVKP